METVGSSCSSPSSSTGRSSRAGSSPACRRLARTRVASSAVALVVKVSPSTSPGATRPVATSQTTRAAITVVLPEPAPATTTAGSSGAVIAANCWSLKTNVSPSRSRSCSGVSTVCVAVRCRGGSGCGS